VRDKLTRAYAVTENGALARTSIFASRSRNRRASGGRTLRVTLYPLCDIHLAHSAAAHDDVPIEWRALISRRFNAR